MPLACRGLGTTREWLAQRAAMTTPRYPEVAHAHLTRCVCVHDAQQHPLAQQHAGLSERVRRRAELNEMLVSSDSSLWVRPTLLCAARRTQSVPLLKMIRTLAAYSPRCVKSQKSDHVCTSLMQALTFIAKRRGFWELRQRNRSRKPASKWRTDQPAARP